MAPKRWSCQTISASSRSQRTAQNANPVEHIWEDIREKQLPNLALPALEGVIDKVCDGLRQLEAAPERLRSMTYFPHFRPAA
jgi:hypothetical protein